MITFPVSPTINQEFPTTGPKRWSWNGFAWDLLTISDAQVALAQAAAVSAAASAATIGTAAAFSDANPVVKSASDPTKLGGFVVGTNVPTGTRVDITWPKSAGTMALTTPTIYYNSGATNALNLANGGHQRWAPNTGAQTLSITGWPAAGIHGDLQIEGVNLGAATITWPTINWVKFDGTFTTTFSANGVTLQASGIDNVILWTRDGGTTIYGKIIR